jgi:hypothetical protein
MHFCCPSLRLFFVVSCLKGQSVRIAGDNPCILVYIYRRCHICCFCIVFVVDVFGGSGRSKGCFGVDVFEYVGNFLCFISEICKCGPFILFVGIFLDMVIGSLYFLLVFF